MKSTIFLASVFGVALSASLNSPSLGGWLAIRATPGKLPWKSRPAAQGVVDQETAFQECAASHGLNEDLCGTEFYCASFGNLDTLKQLPELEDHKFDFASEDECLKAHDKNKAHDKKKSNDEQLEEFCNRLGDKKAKENKACWQAAKRCTGRVQRDASMNEFLNCVDKVQVCADYEAPKHDQCFRHAKECKEDTTLNIALGELTKLATCARGRTDAKSGN